MISTMQCHELMKTWNHLWRSVIFRNLTRWLSVVLLKTTPQRKCLWQNLKWKVAEYRPNTLSGLFSMYCWIWITFLLISFFLFFIENSVFFGTKYFLLVIITSVKHNVFVCLLLSWSRRYSMKWRSNFDGP